MSNNLDVATRTLTAFFGIIRRTFPREKADGCLSFFGGIGIGPRLSQKWSSSEHESKTKLLNFHGSKEARLHFAGPIREGTAKEIKMGTGPVCAGRDERPAIRS
jgi:hypothetical protein